MKTKIIYISGNEVFDIADIRAAFEEVRNALNLDKNTVLFGVPVDAEDAGLSVQPQIQTETPVVDTVVQTDDTIIVEDTDIEPVIDITASTETIVSEETVPDSQIEEKPVKKRGRSRKVADDIEKTTTETEPVAEPVVEKPESIDEKIVPILSVLSGNDEQDISDTESENIITDDENSTIEENTETITEIVAEKIEIQSDDLKPEEIEQISEKIEIDESDTDIEPDLEQLLSAMKPLQEDIMESQSAPQKTPDSESDENIDATLEQLANEFVQTQDKIASETKSSTRSKIGKLRNILPFKQSKHKDQGLGDLFGWAGVAANDEEFSVPGFFTNASSRK